MVDRVFTQTIEPVGGLRTNVSPVAQGITDAGSLIEARNFEADNESGGYRRISGFTKFDSTAVTGTGKIKGVFVFNNGVVAARGTELYFSTGTGWTKINSASFNASATKYRGHRYNFTGKKIIIVNDFDYPVRWDGTTFDHLTNANFPNIPTDVEGVCAVWSFKNHMFLAKGELVFFSAPGDETDYSAGNGGGTINVGFDVLAIRSFRENLYLFGENSIMKITGSTAADFSLEPVSTNIGIVGPDSLQEIAGDLVYLSRDGLRTIRISEEVDTLNLDNISRTVKKELDAMDLNSGNKEISSSVIREKNQYRLFGSDSTETPSESMGFLGSFRRQPDGNMGLEWFQLKGIQASTADSEFINNLETSVHGNFDGFVYKQESGDDFDGTEVDALIKFPYWVYLDPETGGALTRRRKILHKLTIHTLVEGQVNPTIKFNLDYLDADKIQPSGLTGLQPSVGFSLYDSTTTTYDADDTYDDSAQQVVTEFNLVGTCFNSAMSIESKDTLAPYTIQLIAIEYGLGGKR